PVGGPAEPRDFLNSVIGVRTALGPFALLEPAHRAERAARRERLVRWVPRTLDADVITSRDWTSQDAALTAPHPRAHPRALVLAPWNAARSDAELRGHGPLAPLLAAAADREGLWPGPEVEGYGSP